MARPTTELTEQRKQFMQTMLDCMAKPSVFAKIFFDMELFPKNQAYADCKDRWVVYRSGRQNGKTTSTAVKTLHYAWFAPVLSEIAKAEKRCDIVIVAPTENQARIMFGRIQDLLEKSAVLKQFVIKNTQGEIILNWMNGEGKSHIYTRAAGESGVSVRGYSPNVIICDEASFLPDRIIVSLIPSGLAKGVHVWLTSTPFTPAGFFWEACMDSKPMKTLGKWTEFHSTYRDSPIIMKDPDYIEQMRSKMSKDAWQMEMEGEFVLVGDAFIPQSMIAQSLEEVKNRTLATYYMGVDVSRAGKDETCFQVIAVDLDKEAHLVETYRESQSNLVDLAGKIQMFVDRYHLTNVYIDATGVGAGLIDICRAHNIPVYETVMSLEEQEKLYKNLRMLFEKKRIHMNTVDARDTAWQLSYLKVKFTEGNKMRVVSEQPDDLADALALACKVLDTGGGMYILETKKGWLG